MQYKYSVILEAIRNNKKCFEMQVVLPIYWTEKQERSKVLVCLKSVGAGRWKCHLPSAAAFG